MKKNLTPPISFPAAFDVGMERETNTIGRKIAEGRKRMGWNLATVIEGLRAYGIELTKASVSKWETGETVPNAYQFVAICSLLKLDDRISSYHSSQPNELNEEGLSLLARYKRDLICSGNYAPADGADGELIEMPVALMPVAAGTGNLLDDDEYFEMESFLRADVPAPADVGIRVSGDSMEPVYHDGDLVWVQKCGDLQPGETGIFLYDGKAYLKQYAEQLPEEADLEDYTDSYGVVHKQPVLISFNSEKYAPIYIMPYSSFLIYGRVVK